MKIRILNSKEMCTYPTLLDGEIIEVEECDGGYDQIDGVFGFLNEWQDKYFEIVNESVVTKLTTNHYVDVQGWTEDKIKKAAEMFSEHTGKPIWHECGALSVDGEFHYLGVGSTTDIYVSGYFKDIGSYHEEVSQDNFNQLLEEWEMQKQVKDSQHSVLNGDHVYTKDLSTEQYEMLGDALVKAGFVGEYPDDQHHSGYGDDWVFGVDWDGENNHGTDGTTWFTGGRNLSFEQFMQNLKPHSQEAVIPMTNVDNLTVVEAPTSNVSTCLVQRITLAHKAALQACQEAVEAYNTYKGAVDELKEEVGSGFKIEEVRWEDMFTNREITLEELSPEEWQEGDIVECIDDDRLGFTIGNKYTLADVVDDDNDVFVKEDDVGDHYYIQASKLKWISRPQ